MKNITFFLVLLVGFILFVDVSSAILTHGDSVSADIPTYKKGDTIQLTSVCNNCSYVNLTKVTFPNGSLILLGQFPMTKNGTNYNYTFSNTNAFGEYNYVTCGDLDGILTCADTDNKNFEITGTGFKFNTSNSLFYIALLGLLVFLFILNAVGIAKLPSGNPRADSGNILSISLLKYLKPVLFVVAWGLIISILLIASSISGAYLGDPSFSNFLFKLFKLSTILIYPMVVFGFIIVILNIFQDVKINKLFNRGIIPQ